MTLTRVEEEEEALHVQQGFAIIVMSLVTCLKIVLKKENNLMEEVEVEVEIEIMTEKNKNNLEEEEITIMITMIMDGKNMLAPTNLVMNLLGEVVLVTNLLTIGVLKLRLNL